jgi:hypothetical protein
VSEFARVCECGHCGRRYSVTGVAANPDNETQSQIEFRCACGAEVEAFLPGSTNRDLVRIALVGS